MGWNTARVTLLPPRWKETVTESAHARTAAGTPVRIARAVRAEDSAGQAVLLVPLSRWMEERGFVVTERSPSHMQVQREDVEAFLAAEGDEVAEVILTFTLTRDSPRRWETWQKFAAELAGAWDLALFAPDRPGGKPGAGDLLRLLSGTPAWQGFQAAFGWPSPTPPAADGDGVATRT
jgi:hypothetical protein